MKNDTNGSGLYKRTSILEEPPVKIQKTTLPDIKEIKAIIHDDGEIYINAKDVALMMKKCSYKFQSASVMNFVRRFVLNLIG